MRQTMIAMIAATALLAACSTASDTSGTASASGSAAGAVSGAGAGTRIMPGSQQDLQQNAGDRIFFATDESTITSEGREILVRQAEWLKRYPAVTITIEGHCDERGVREYNLALGERRANMARQVLLALGVDPGRVATTSYGKERPAVIGSNEAAWAQNRRAVTIVN